MADILIVDDDLNIGNLLEEILTKEGYAVSRAYSGTEAVLFVRQKKPDLVLLDMMLPGIGGEEVLPHLKGIPVIVVSAKLDVDEKVGMLLQGAADYVTKLFDVRERAETMRTLCEVLFRCSLVTSDDRQPPF